MAAAPPRGFSETHSPSLTLQKLFLSLGVSATQGALEFWIRDGARWAGSRLL